MHHVFNTGFQLLHKEFVLLLLEVHASTKVCAVYCMIQRQMESQPGQQKNSALPISSVGLNLLLGPTRSSF